MREPAELNAHQWKLVGLLGATIILNHYDFMVLNFALSHIQEGLNVAEADIGSVVAYTRLGVIPALLLAMISDRVGRRRLLLITVVGFTLCSTLTAFVRDITEFTALQFLARMFINAEEMLAIVVIAEELDAKSRGFGLGILAALGSLGAGLAAIVFGFVEILPFGWRALYLVCVVPLFYLVWLRRELPETARFEAENERRLATEGGTPRSYLQPIRDLLQRYPRRMLALCAAIFPAAVVMISASTFVPKTLLDVHGYAAGDVTILYLVAGLLVFVSNALAGNFADRFGRRRVLVAALLLNGLGIAAFFNLSGPAIIVAWILMMASLVGIDVLFGALGSELFPTAYRSTASATRALTWMVGGSIGLWIEQWIFPFAGDHPTALTWMLCLVWIAPLVVVFFLPETAKRELEDISPDFVGSP